MKLHEIQESFKDTIADPAALNGHNSAFRGALSSGTGICLENRMKVYRNNVIRGLSDAVMAAYPVTEKLTGKDFMEAATRAYVIRNFPEQGNLNLYGATFPDFLAQYEPAQNIPYLPDVARMEWAWEESYYAPDDTPLAPEALQNLETDRLPLIKLSFRASVRFVESSYPLDEIYDICNAAGNGPSEDMVGISQRGAKMLVFRDNYTVEARRLDEAEYSFMTALYDGAPIIGAAERAFACDSKFDLTGCLQKHLSNGLFKAFSLQESTEKSQRRQNP